MIGWQADSGIETKYYANSVLSTCHSVCVIACEPGTPDTTKINRSLVSKIAIISVPKRGSWSTRSSFGKRNVRGGGCWSWKSTSLWVD